MSAEAYGRLHGSRTHTRTLRRRPLIGRGRPAEAAIFNVTTTDDEADVGACLPADPDCALREAIIAANAASTDDTINLGAEMYGLSIVGDDNTAAAGDLDIADNGALTLAGAGAGATTVDGNDIDRVFHLLSGGTATFRG